MLWRRRLRLRAAALMTALLATTVFLVLALSLLSQHAHQYSGERRQQQLIQARWNARSGLDAFLDSGEVPSDKVWDFGDGNRCQLVEEQPDLVFAGFSSSCQVQIRCLGGDPGRTVETLTAR